MARPKRPTNEEMTDAAEKLIGRRGFHGACVRVVTNAAGVDLARANYHFDGKKQTFTEILERPGRALNEDRLRKQVDERHSAAPNPRSTEAIVAVFLDRLSHAWSVWRNFFFALLTDVNNLPEWGVRS